MRTGAWMLVAVAGWVAAGAAAMGWYQTHRERAQQTAAVDEAQQAFAAAAERAEAHREQVAAQSEEIAALQRTLAEAEDQMAALEDERQQQARMEALKERLVSAGNSPVEAAEAEVGEATNEDRPDGFAGFMSNMMDEDMVAFSVQAQLDMQYGALFDRLGLAPEREAEVREAMRGVLEDQMHDTMRIFEEMEEGAGDNDEAFVPPDLGDGFDPDAALLAELEPLLSAEELDEVAQYQEELPERMARRQVEMQLGLHGSEIPLESRALISDVWVEEQLYAQDEREALDAPTIESEPATGIAQERVVLERVRARLEGVLPEDELRVLDRIDQQYVQAGQLMRNFRGRESEDADAESETP